MSGWVGLPPSVAAVLFTAVIGGACYALPQAQMDVFNGVLVLVMMAAFAVGPVSGRGASAKIEDRRADFYHEAPCPSLYS